MPDTISATGVVGTQPSLTISGNGMPRLTFRLASGQRKYNRDTGAWENGETNWYTVVAFRRLAENAEQSLSKGERVVVTGRLRVNEWEKEGVRNISVDLIADGIGHDLAFGTSTYAKSAPAAVHTTSAAPDQAAIGQAGPEPEAGGARPAQPAVDADGWALPGALAGDPSAPMRVEATTPGDDSAGGVPVGPADEADEAELAQLEFATAEPPF